LVASGLSVRRASALVQIHRSTFQYTAHPADDTAVLSQVQELAAQHPRYGYRPLSVLLNRKERVNQKRVRRLWRQKRLQVRHVVRKRRRRPRPECLQAAYPGHIWAYDFVEDALADGKALRILTVMDEFTFLWAGHRRGRDDFGGAGYQRAGRAGGAAWRSSVSAQR
jgi:putative transposase